MLKERALRAVLTAVAGIAVLTVLLVVLAVLRLGRDATCTTKTHNILHPRTICTVFTATRGSRPIDAAEELGLPVYPSAAAIYRVERKWIQASQVPAALFLIQYQTAGHLEEVDKWYQKSLDANFLRTPGRITNPINSDDWIGKLEEAMSSDKAILFRRQDGKTQRGVGVILVPLEEKNEVEIGIFYHTGAKRQ